MRCMIRENTFSFATNISNDPAVQKGACVDLLFKVTNPAYLLLLFARMIPFTVVNQYFGSHVARSSKLERLVWGCGGEKGFLNSKFDAVQLIEKEPIVAENNWAE